MDGLTEGRIVHFVMPNGDHRPAIIVRVWNKATGYVNLQVFTDGSNDFPFVTDGQSVQWETSIEFSEEPKPRTWHWIEKA